MMFVVPVSWAAIIPGTFLIAFLGLTLSSFLVQPGDTPRGTRIEVAWTDAKKGMWRAWINLCAAYAFGTALMLAPALLTVGLPETNAARQAAFAVTENIYQSLLAVIWAIFCLLVSAGFSYLLNRAWTYRKTTIKDVRRAAGWFAVVTAPWLFLSTYRLYF